MAYTKRQMEDYQRIENKLSEVTGRHTDEIRTVLIRLQRYETTLQRINENDCNGHPRMKTECRDGKMYRFEVEDQKWAERDAKKEKSIREKVTALLKPYNIEVRFNGDPRGGAIRMLLPDHSSNGWDGETWGIYW
jgi:hypothetical protein